MKLPRCRFLHLAAGAAALPVLSCMARAQNLWGISMTGSHKDQRVTRDSGSLLTPKPILKFTPDVVF